MKRLLILVAAVIISACSASGPSQQQIAEAQAKSEFGSTARWKLDPSVSRYELQAMRDRAYGYCHRQKPADASCPLNQDASLFYYARSFALIRIYRTERSEPKSPYIVGHQADPAAFDKVKSYCRSIYEDHGASDARVLGPCMMDGLGGDFFGVAVVP